MRNLFKFALVLLSASVERVGVSRTRDFCLVTQKSQNYSGPDVDIDFDNGSLPRSIRLWIHLFLIYLSELHNPCDGFFLGNIFITNWLFKYSCFVYNCSHFHKFMPSAPAPTWPWKIGTFVRPKIPVPPTLCRAWFHPKCATLCQACTNTWKASIPSEVLSFLSWNLSTNSNWLKICLCCQSR